MFQVRRSSTGFKKTWKIFLRNLDNIPLHSILPIKFLITAKISLISSLRIDRAILNLRKFFFETIYRYTRPIKFLTTAKISSFDRAILYNLCTYFSQATSSSKIYGYAINPNATHEPSSKISNRRENSFQPFPAREKLEILIHRWLAINIIPG